MCYRRLSSILATGIYIMRFAGLSIIIHSLVGNGTKQLGRLAGFLPSIAAMSEVAYPHRDRGNQGELELERTRPQAWPQGQSTFQKTTHRTDPRKRYINQPCLRRSSAGADNQAPRNGASCLGLTPRFLFCLWRLALPSSKETGRVIYAVSYWYCMSVRCDPANFFRVTSLG